MKNLKQATSQTTTDVYEVFSMSSREQAMISIVIASCLSLVDVKRPKNRVKMIVFDVSNSIYLSDRTGSEDRQQRVKKEWKEVVEMQF